MESESRPEQSDDGAKLHRIVAGVLFAYMVLSLIPKVGVERRLGGAERHVRIAPKRVDAAWVVVAGVRPGGLGVNQVGDDGANGGELARLGGHQSPLGHHVVFRVGQGESVRLRVVHVITPHTAPVAHGPGHLGALVVFQFLLDRQRIGVPQAGVVIRSARSDQANRVEIAQVYG